VICGILVWGDLTLKDLRATDANIRQANQNRLDRIAHLRALERSLDDLNARVEAPLTNKNPAAQTRLILAMQDQRSTLWTRLEPLKEAIAKDPVRLNGIEIQFDALGAQIGELIKVLGKEGQAEAQKIRQEVWNARFLSVRKSLRGLSDQLQREVEAEWQATRLTQDEQLWRLILGSAAIAAFALLWVGVLLTRLKTRQSKFHEHLDALAKLISVPAEGKSPENRFEHLIAAIKQAPVGPRFLQALADSSSQPIGLVVDGGVYASSPGFRKLAGERAQGQPFRDLFKDLELDQASLEQALGQASGEWVNILLQNEAPSTLSVRVSSLAHRSQRAVELRDAREEFLEQSTIDQITEFTDKHLLTGRLELSGEVIEASDSTCSYLGATAADLKMAHLTDFDLGIEPEQLLAMGQAIAQEGRWEGEIPLRRQGGPGLVLAQVTRGQLDNDARDTLSVIGLARDELVQAKAKIESLADELTGRQTVIEKSQEDLASERSRLTTEATQAMQSFSLLMDLINTFGSEMRDPLNGAVGLTELLADTGETLRVDQLRNVNDTLTNLVYSLLDHANLEAGSLPLESEPIDFEQMVRHMTTRYTRHLRGSDIQLDYAPPEETLALGKGDPTRVTQIIDALIARSTFFALPGAMIRVRLDSDDQGRPRCQIFDAGGPMPEEAEEEIFALASYSGAAGASRWTGMEPAVLKSLAAGMQAELHAEVLGEEVVWSLTLAEADSGSVVTQAAVPIATAMAMSRQDLSDPEIPPVVNARVLVADDDEVNRLVATGLLERIGCSPVVVEDGQEAIDQLEDYLVTGGAAPFDLILLDLMMPRLGGLDATQMIRAAEERLTISKTERIPIIAVTAKASDEDQQICLSVGMNGFVSKPYRYEELQDLITQLIG
jgi:CheY-like chemotaxis protein/signal transduction histidine kinase